MKKNYKIIGPHIVKIPPGIEITVPAGVKLDPVLIPIDRKLEEAELEGWTLVEIIQGFPINIPQSSLTLPGKSSVISLVGVCALLTKNMQAQIK